MNLNNAIYFIQDLENTGKKRIKFLTQKIWRTEKVLVWTDSSAFLSYADQCTLIYGVLVLFYVRQHS